ncbi:hypothetical protein P879_05155 [Paragonimus westermani]|uniref:Enkurin domain-containing protein n=1 Tax=Paragonimus westermani TaxID=34504 RepID=A0A8T0DKT2_9TREM|nr:hypothetical protein P879_05155 [Paragonimus westermani]
MREFIYNLIPKIDPPQQKPPRYISSFKPEAVKEMKHNRYPWKTIGPAQVNRSTPEDFLKKKCRGDRLPIRRSLSVNADTRTSFRDCLQTEKKAPLPSATKDSQLACTFSSRDYVTLNKIAAQELVPKKSKKVLVDTRHGDKLDLTPSGLELIYVNKKEFGQVPDYLIGRAKAVANAIMQYNAYVKQMQEENALFTVTEEEKQALLAGLKEQWQHRYRQYQSLPVMIDTPPKMHRKLWLEKVLTDLEKDIELVERYQTIYVAH